MPAGQQAKPEAHETAFGHGQHPQPFTEKPFGLHVCVGGHEVAFQPENAGLTGHGVQLGAAAADAEEQSAAAAAKTARGMARYN